MGDMNRPREWSVLQLQHTSHPAISRLCDLGKVLNSSLGVFLDGRMNSAQSQVQPAGIFVFGVHTVGLYDP